MASRLCHMPQRRGRALICIPGCSAQFVVSRPYLSPRVLPFASATKAPNRMGFYSLTDPGGMEG